MGSLSINHWRSGVRSYLPMLASAPHPASRLPPKLGIGAQLESVLAQPLPHIAQSGMATDFGMPIPLSCSKFCGPVRPLLAAPEHAAHAACHLRPVCSERRCFRRGLDGGSETPSSTSSAPMHPLCTLSCSAPRAVASNGTPQLTSLAAQQIQLLQRRQ